mmetsp:Transcript_65730/g.154686  ORF Transcript_65730/g.154686 Transcript_65730/m.154686 type:complete len:335 (-) Transcript_65730:1699-2703(-)
MVVDITAAVHIIGCKLFPHHCDLFQCVPGVCAHCQFGVGDEFGANQMEHGQVNALVGEILHFVGLFILLVVLRARAGRDSCETGGAASSGGKRKTILAFTGQQYADRRFQQHLLLLRGSDGAESSLLVWRKSGSNAGADLLDLQLAGLDAQASQSADASFDLQTRLASLEAAVESCSPRHELLLLEFSNKLSHLHCVQRPRFIDIHLFYEHLLHVEVGRVAHPAKNIPHVLNINLTKTVSIVLSEGSIEVHDLGPVKALSVAVDLQEEEEVRDCDDFGHGGPDVCDCMSQQLRAACPTVSRVPATPAGNRRESREAADSCASNAGSPAARPTDV